MDRPAAGRPPMSVQDEAPRKVTFECRRRGVRLNSRVPVLVEWESADGTSVQEKAHTRTVGPYGCLVVLAKKLELDQRVRVTNLATHVTSPAVVVWSGNERAEGWELGFELLDPEMGFWGLEL